MAPGVSIIVLNWNGREYLGDCLSSVFNQAYDNFQVILVDNHSTDDSVSFVRENFPKAKIIALDKNYGFSKGNNIAIKYTLKKHNPEYILLLNNDTKFISDDTLRKFVDSAMDTRIGILGCRLIDATGVPQVPNVKINPFDTYWERVGCLYKKPPKLYEIDSVQGAVFLISRSVIDKIGLLDEIFSPFFFEDGDYCARAREAGFSVRINTAIEVVHHSGQALKKYPSIVNYWAFRKNTIIYVLLNFRWYSLIFHMLYEGHLIFKDVFYYRNSLIFILSIYLEGIKNLRKIISRRLNRRAKL